MHYWVVSLLSLISLLFVLGGAIWDYASLLNSGSAPYILHFNDIDGITKVGGLENLVLMGILGVIIVLINFLIAIELESRDEILAKMVSVATLVVSILLFLSFIAILNVN